MIFRKGQLLNHIVKYAAELNDYEKIKVTYKQNRILYKKNQGSISQLYL